MNIFNQIKLLPNLLMNKFSSVFLSSNVITSFLSADNLLTRLLKSFLQILYFSCKWIMYIVDVIYFYVLQLAGVSADTSIFDSSSSDMTLKLLIDNKELVTTIIKNFIGIAIVLILVTAIIAIIKQQASALKSPGKGGNSGDVLRSVFKSLLLIILTPLIALLGIVSSSVILQGLFNATNLSNTKSLSARVFNVSASAANKYKLYADNGVRIPIVYKFSGEDKEDAINYTVQMVGNGNFPSLDYFDVNANFYGVNFNDPVLEDTVIVAEKYATGTDEWVNEVYYNYYDTSDSYNRDARDGSQYKILQTHANEYYAMSDVIGYALDTMEEYYFVTIQELLESLANKDADSFGTIASNYNVVIGTSSGEISVSGSGGGHNADEMIEALNKGAYTYIKYTSTYASGNYDYIHVKNAVDELEGAKFVIAYKKEYDTEFEKSINGDLYKKADGTYAEADKYYLKESGSSRYKKVDLYYYYDENKGDYVKTASFDSSKNYYYKIGEDYKSVTDDLKNKFYYKNENGDYVSLTYGSPDTFYSSTKAYGYLPLVNGIKVNDNPTFSSEYIKSGIITARGVFDNSSYPTAIRKTSSGDVVFYRDDLELVSDGSMSSVGSLDQTDVEEDDSEGESEDESEEGFFSKVWSGIKNVVSSVKKFVTNLFNPLKLVPDLNIDESKMATTYTKTTNEVFVLSDSKLHISYFFADSLTSSLSAKLYGINLNNLFDPLSINYVTLVVGSIILFKIMVTSIFGLINRAINLFIMIMIYPIACATIPLDEIDKKQKSGSYTKWSQKYTQLLFSTYGLILGINFVFILIPIIDKIEFFKVENLASNRALGRIANALFNPWTILGVGDNIVSPNYVLVTKFLNKLLQIIFQIAAFSLVTSSNGKGDSYYTVIQTVVGTGPGALEDSPLDAVKKTLKTATKVINTMVFPGKAIKNTITNSKEKVKSFAQDMIPGSAIGNAAKEKLKIIDEKFGDTQSRAESIAEKMQEEQANSSSSDSSSDAGDTT